MDIYPAAAELIRDVRIAQPITGTVPPLAVCATLRFGDWFPGKILMAVRAPSSPALRCTLFDACLSAQCA
jgi:hypothetical protein